MDSDSDGKIAVTLDELPDDLLEEEEDALDLKNG